jgi:3-phenylpropionate/trans-cinnamate dioxygenase ferredoxin component
MPFTTVARVSEIPTGKGKQVALSGLTIAIFNDGGQIYAVAGVCPHRGAPLAEGTCQQGQVMCPWHSARFDLSTGQNLCPPAKTGVPTYKVQVVGDEIQVDA